MATSFKSTTNGERKNNLPARGPTHMERKPLAVRYQTDDGQKVVLTEAVIKRYLVSGEGRVTDQEILMFISLCKYRRLNPFLREAYLVKYSDKSPASIVVSKDYYMRHATKNPKCTGFCAGVIVKNVEGKLEEREGTLVLPGEELLGGWATVYRDGWQIPLHHRVSLQEYQRKTKEGELTHSWATMPATMIRKVALVQALREVFPEDFAGLYSPEEMPVEPSDLPETPIMPPEEHVIDVEEQTTEEIPPEAPPETKAEESDGAQADKNQKKFFARLNEWAKKHEIDVQLVQNEVKPMIYKWAKVSSLRELQPEHWAQLATDKAWQTIAANLEKLMPKFMFEQQVQEYLDNDLELDANVVRANILNVLREYGVQAQKWTDLTLADYKLAWEKADEIFAALVAAELDEELDETVENATA